MSARRGRRDMRAGRGAQPCTHRFLSAVSRPISVGIVPVSWLLFKCLRSRVASASRRAWNGEHGGAGRCKVSARRGRKEGRAGCEAPPCHAQIDEPRQLANFGWDRTGELVGAQPPAQRRVASASTESVGRRARRWGQRSERAASAEGGASGRERSRARTSVGAPPSGQFRLGSDR